MTRQTRKRIKTACWVLAFIVFVTAAMCLEAELVQRAAAIG
jgi:hypothetical protein